MIVKMHLKHFENIQVELGKCRSTPKTSKPYHGYYNTPLQQGIGLGQFDWSKSTMQAQVHKKILKQACSSHALGALAMNHNS